MGRLFLRYLDSSKCIYKCNTCDAHLAVPEDVVSKDFQGTLGKAYLFAKCVNVACAPKEERYLVTGMHTVCDVFCVSCRSIVGWRYIKAKEPEQKYKEGKTILEKMRICRQEQNPTQHLVSPTRI
uniref:Protein yippee-like n=1 Tax=Chromera velia CCMP2878 TaxID=1169474 RepID=A0A0G4HZI6_9ALVE|mmetsp:Transcript_12839/g.25102  ORF Transcript_12839/g.25102 Transcript_12839/m.25102 type:complete len:125 (-) Transcript_12839:886-1260(-)|eukprot:Cvel_1572.t1-p1 / transcript=Cvel_1572.t1 / gene=Cvel_1572 / organism=Chromera_velia_CCMP2878 / gene_product=Protein yippee-like, putative / transcript_product=Protein yippee-like, putative / location=Cvel_scaffold56:34095-35337(-) / protein_length=124 / sequence_SO=supercontig / SO=protein_coding / is_pseudo=false